MKQFRIILSSGKEISFIADDKFIKQQCIDNSYYTAPDGTSYNFARQDIAATIIQLMRQCLYCSKWMIPIKARTDFGRISLTNTYECSERGGAIDNG